MSRSSKDASELSKVGTYSMGNRTYNVPEIERANKKKKEG